jgi:predicted GIY-YIG superfamily endonuclease
VNHVAAVYRLFDAAKKLLYVGVAKDFGSRWKRHAKEQYWWDQVHSQSVIWYDDRKEALTAEIRAINKEGPLHNKLGSPWELIKDEVTGFYVIPKACSHKVRTVYCYREATAREHAIALAGMLREGVIPADPMLREVLPGLTEVVREYLAGTLSLATADFGAPNPGKVRLGEILAQRGAQGASVAFLWAALGAEGLAPTRQTVHVWLREYELAGLVTRPQQPRHPRAARWAWNARVAA